MRKMSKEAGNVRFQAFASTDGITINPVRELGPLSFLSSLAVKATLKPGGKIDCKQVRFRTQHTQDDMMLADESRMITLASRFLGLILFGIFLFFLFRPDTRAAELVLSLWFLNYSFQFIAYPVVMFIKRMFGNKSAQSLARFHAAEHAVINGYYDLQRVPTIEEIHDYSSYSYRCGSLNSFKYGLLFIGFAVARLVPGLWFLVAMLVAWIVDFILVKTNGLTFMEFLVLDEPTDTEYAVAIKAMEESVKNVDLSPYLSDMESIFKLAMLVGVVGVTIEGNAFCNASCDGCPNYDKCQTRDRNK